MEIKDIILLEHKVNFLLYSKIIAFVPRSLLVSVNILFLVGETKLYKCETVERDFLEKWKPLFDYGTFCTLTQKGPYFHSPL